NCARRSDFAFGRAPIDRLARNIFELEGQQIEAFREIPHGRFIFVCAGEFAVGELTSGRIFFRTENVDPVTHAPGCDGEHAAELPTSHQADRRARQVAPRHGTRWVSTASVCRFRNASTFFRIFSWLRARMLAARRAALVAPAVPMASVPTGTPAGIWAMERRESIPWRAWDWIGTPRTGSQVCAA